MKHMSQLIILDKSPFLFANIHYFVIIQNTYHVIMLLYVIINYYLS